MPKFKVKVEAYYAPRLIEKEFVVEAEDLETLEDEVVDDKRFSGCGDESWERTIGPDEVGVLSIEQIEEEASA